MKIYFVKSLPITGPLNQRGCGCAEGFQDLCENWDEKEEHCKLCPKTRLFICSTDVKVGNYADGYGIKYSIIHNKPLLIVADGEVGPKEGNWANISANHDWWKIVGQVSPNALDFVNEEQQFDEKDIQVETDFVKVRCPRCNRFH